MSSTEFIEVTEVGGKKLLINLDKVSFFSEQDGKNTLVYKHCVFEIEESNEEIKKRLGQKITPRAETLALQ